MYRDGDAGLMGRRCGPIGVDYPCRFDGGIAEDDIGEREIGGRLDVIWGSFVRGRGLKRSESRERDGWRLRCRRRMGIDRASLMTESCFLEGCDGGSSGEEHVCFSGRAGGFSQVRALRKGELRGCGICYCIA